MFPKKNLLLLNKIFLIYLIHLTIRCVYISWNYYYLLFLHINISQWIASKIYNRSVKKLFIGYDFILL